MKRTIFFAILCSLAVATLPAKSEQPVPPAPQPDTPGIHEFQGVAINYALFTLAQEGGLDVVLCDDLNSSIDFHVTNKTARQTFDIIAAVKNLVVEEKDGILYVRAKPIAKPSSKSTEGGDAKLIPTLAKLYDAYLDHQALPDTAKKIAKAKRTLYDQLVAEGFSKDEALRVIATNQTTTLPEAGK